MTKLSPLLLLFALYFWGCGTTQESKGQKGNAPEVSHSANPKGDGGNSGKAIARGSSQGRGVLTRTQELIEEGLRSMRETQKRVKQSFDTAEQRLRELYAKHAHNPELQKQLQKNLKSLKQQYERTRRSLEKSALQLKQQLEKTRKMVAEWVSSEGRDYKAMAEGTTP